MTPEQKARLEALKAKYGSQQPIAPAVDKKARLEELKAKFEGTPTPASIATSPTTQPEPSMGDKARAAIQGFGENASFGYLPQLQGAASVSVDKVLRGLGSIGVGPYRKLEELEAAGIEAPESKPATLLEERDLAIREGKEIAAKAPGYHTAGQVGGAIASIPLAGAAGKLLAGGAKLIPGAASAMQKVSSAIPAANTFTGGAIRGGASGLAYNPGDTEGEIGGMQLGDRLVNAALGAGVGGISGTIADKIGKASRSKGVYNRMQSGEFSGELKDTIEKAQGGLREKVISPASNQLDELLADKTVKISPSNLKEFTKEALDVAGDDAKLINNYISRQTPDANRLLELPAVAARRLKTAAGKAAYGARDKASGAPSVVSKEFSKVEQALADKLTPLAPEVQSLNDKMSGAINLQKALEKAYAEPVNKFSNIKPGSELFDAFKQTDKATGSNLYELGKDIASAKQLESAGWGDVPNATKSLWRALKRAVGGGAQGYESVSTPIKAATGSETPIAETITRLALEGKRKKGK